MNRNELAAEFIGTFSLVFAGCGAITADARYGGVNGHQGINESHPFTGPCGCLGSDDILLALPRCSDAGSIPCTSHLQVDSGIGVLPSQVINQ